MLHMPFLSERLEVRQRIYSCLRRILGLGLSTPNMVSAPTVTERWNRELASGSYEWCDPRLEMVRLSLPI